MRVLFVACLLMIFSLTNFAQVVKYGGEEMPLSNSPILKLETALRQLASKEQLLLSYESNLLDHTYTFANIDQLSLEESLKSIFQDSDLEYIITKDKQLLVRKKIQTYNNYSWITGRIRDRESHEFLSYTMIYLDGTTIGNYADSTGRFRLMIPYNYKSNNDTVVIQRIGYNKKKIALTDFIENMDITLDITASVFHPVTILSKLAIKGITNNSGFTSIYNQAYDIQTIGKDLLRKLQFLPSVSGNHDNSAKLHIRGSETYETLVLIDGLRIYNPTHFYEVFGSINPTYVGAIDLYKNSIPVDTRSMTGGVVKLRSKEIDNSNIKADIDLNLMDLTGVLSIPLFNNFKLLFSGRKSIFDRTRQSFFGEIISANQFDLSTESSTKVKVKSNNQAFNYFDINTKAIWTIGARSSLTFNYYHSEDQYQKIYDQSIHRSFSKIKINYKYKDQAYWNNLGMGLKYKIDWNDKLSTSIFYSKSRYKENGGLELQVTTTPVEPEKGRTLNNNQVSALSDIELKIDNSYKVNKKSKVDFGIDVTTYMVNSNIRINKKSIFNQSDSNRSYLMYSGYEKNWKKIVLGIGLQSSYYTGTDRFYHDPSVSIQSQVTDHLKVYGFINRQHQYIREMNYESPQGKNTNLWTISNTNIPILSAINYTLGSSFITPKNNLSVELFFKEKKGLSTLLLARPGDDISMSTEKNYRLFFGKGRGYGIEFSWNHKVNNYNSYLAYTYSYNEQKYKHIFHNQYHPAPDDTRHQVKWAQAYKYNKFDIGLNFVYSNGLPYFDFSDFKRGEHRRDLSYKEVIEYLPDYFRADITTSYRFNLWSNPAQVYLSVFNLTNRINVTNHRIIKTNINVPETNNLLESQTNLLSRTINLGFRIKI